MYDHFLTAHEQWNHSNIADNMSPGVEHSLYNRGVGGTTKSSSFVSFLCVATTMLLLDN